MAVRTRGRLVGRAGRDVAQGNLLGGLIVDDDGRAVASGRGKSEIHYGTTTAFRRWYQHLQNDLTGLGWAVWYE